MAQTLPDHGFVKQEPGGAKQEPSPRPICTAIRTKPVVAPPVVEPPISAASSPRSQGGESVASDAPGSAKMWVTNFIKNKKPLYNKFIYRVRQDPTMMSQWTTLRTTGSAKEAEDYIKEKMRGLEDVQETVETSRVVESEDEEAEQGSWISYRKAMEEEGKEELDEMIRLKTVTTRVNKKLIGSAIEYPFNLQVKHVVESTLKRRKKTNRTSRNYVDADLAEGEAAHILATAEASAAFEAGAENSGRTGPGHPETKQEAREEAARNKEEEEKGKEAIASIRKGHSAWDRTKRDFNGTLKLSEACDMTANTLTEKKLTDLIATGDADDKILVGYETTYVTKGCLGTSEMVDAAAIATRLAENMKTGKLLQVALKGLMKIGKPLKAGQAPACA